MGKYVKYNTLQNMCKGNYISTSNFKFIPKNALECNTGFYNTYN